MRLNDFKVMVLLLVVTMFVSVVYMPVAFGSFSSVASGSSQVTIPRVEVAQVPISRSTVAREPSDWAPRKQRSPPRAPPSSLFLSNSPGFAQSLKSLPPDPEGVINVPDEARPKTPSKCGAVHPPGPIPPPAINVSIKVAIITPFEGPLGVHKFPEMCSFTKACYAAMHNITFILDRGNYSVSHGRHRTWNRVPSLQRYLPQFDWVLYLDADIAISNFSISVLEFLSQIPDDINLVFTDATSGYNAGGFLMRNCPWSFAFLDAWWAISPGPHASGIAGFNSNDQVAAWDLIVNMLLEDDKEMETVGLPARCPPELRDKRCKASPLRHRQDWQRSMNCWTDTMIQCGLAFGERDAIHIMHWDYRRRWPRGLTFFYPDKAAKGTWPRAELYMKGDFVIHTRLRWYMTAASFLILQVSAYDEMKNSAFCAPILDGAFSFLR